MNLQSFEYYLRASGFKESSIEGHVNNIERLQNWVTTNELTGIENITYTELLSYVQHEKKKSLAIQTINSRINSIRKYFEHLKQEGIIETNPSKRLFIKGATKGIIYNPLSYTELEILYLQYVEYLDTKEVRISKHKELHVRNKVIVGFMIWQGVHSGELNKMEVSHIKLNNGTIYIPSTARSKSRELKLASQQILPLNDYLNTLPATQSRLFTTGMHHVVKQLSEELKGLNPVIRNAQHIRASVLLYWLTMYDKRTVQYMAGHKWISSTEHYQVQELTGLTDLLSKHHPFS